MAGSKLAELLGSSPEARQMAGAVRGAARSVGASPKRSGQDGAGLRDKMSALRELGFSQRDALRQLVRGGEMDPTLARQMLQVPDAVGEAMQPRVSAEIGQPQMPQQAQVEIGAPQIAPQRTVSVGEPVMDSMPTAQPGGQYAVQVGQPQVETASMPGSGGGVRQQLAALRSQGVPQSQAIQLLAQRGMIHPRLAEQLMNAPGALQGI